VGRWYSLCQQLSPLLILLLAFGRVTFAFYYLNFSFPGLTNLVRVGNGSFENSALN